MVRRVIKGSASSGSLSESFRFFDRFSCSSSSSGGNYDCIFVDLCMRMSVYMTADILKSTCTNKNMLNIFVVCILHACTACICIHLHRACMYIYTIYMYIYIYIHKYIHIHLHCIHAPLLSCICIPALYMRTSTLYIYIYIYIHQHCIHAQLLSCICIPALYLRTSTLYICKSTLYTCTTTLCICIPAL